MSEATEYRRRVPIERESETRRQIIAEARSWLGTPNGPGEMAKGIGADRATFLVSVFGALGLLTKEEISAAKHLASMRHANRQRKIGKAPRIGKCPPRNLYLPLAENFLVKIAESQGVPSDDLAGGLTPGNILVVRRRLTPCLSMLIIEGTRVIAGGCHGIREFDILETMRSSVRCDATIYDPLLIPVGA